MTKRSKRPVVPLPKKLVGYCRAVYLIDDQGRIVRNRLLKTKDWEAPVGYPAKVYNINGTECLQVFGKMTPLAEVRATLTPEENFRFNGTVGLRRSITNPNRHHLIWFRMLRDKLIEDERKEQEKGSFLRKIGSIAVTPARSRLMNRSSELANASTSPLSRFPYVRARLEIFGRTRTAALRVVFFQKCRFLALFPHSFP